MIQDVYNLGSFIMFLGVRRNPQANTCPLKAIKHVTRQEIYLFIVLFAISRTKQKRKI